MTQAGSTANKTGKNFEDFVQSSLEKQQYQFIDNKRFLSCSKISEQPIFSSQVYVGETVYGKKRYCDFIFYHPKLFPNNYIIECKWQQSGGSVDEKYPFLVLNIKILNIDTTILLDGGGYSDGAELWLKSQVSGALKNVWNMSTFQTKVNKGFLG